MKNNNDFLTGLIGCLFIIFIVISIGAVSALVFMLLWNWLAPMFWPDAPILGFWQTWGIMILIGLITSFFRR